MAATSAAVARQGLYGAHGTPADPPEGFQPNLSAATGTLCVKQCPSDDLPCDPPAFKVADGRCTTAWH